MAKVGGSLLEVARKCAVSQSTVSRVLNNANHGRFSVSPQVRSKILAAARDLNYRPSIAARNLAVTKTHLVAVLGVGGFWSDRVGPIEEAVGAMARKLDAAGYEICIQISSPRHGPFDLPRLRVDGVAALVPASLDELKPLEESKIPYVSIDGIVGPHGAQVVADDAGGTRRALRHLVELGHRRIAYFDNPSTSPHLSVRVRREAFEQSAAEMGFSVPQIDLPRSAVGVPWEPYYEPFLRGAVIEGKATALLCYSHYGAMSLLRKAYDLGLSVPKDFSLMCFNNEPVLSLSVPSITAVDVPSVPLGESAADLLLRAMSSVGKPAPQRCMRVEETLIIRESTAPPGRGMSGSQLG
jgi:DNA-binding LacI/PurR family transcriptional regulator